MDNFDLRKYLAEGKLYKTEEQLLEEGLVDVFNKAKSFIMNKGEQFYDYLKSKLDQNTFNTYLQAAKEVIGDNPTETDFTLDNVKKIASKLQSKLHIGKDEVSVEDGEVTVNESSLEEGSSRWGWLFGGSLMTALTGLLTPLAFTGDTIGGLGQNVTGGSILVGFIALFLAIFSAVRLANDHDETPF